MNLLTFSSTGVTEFSVQNYVDKTNAEFKLRNMKYSGGGTETVAGLMVSDIHIFRKVPYYNTLQGDKMTMLTLTVLVTTIDAQW